MPEPVLSIIEELKDLSLQKFTNRMYDPNFWLPFIPLAHKKVEQQADKEYYFDVSDRISLDPTNTLIQDFKAKGILQVKDCGMQGDKGNLWELYYDVKDPKARIEVRVRVKDLPRSMKIGIFITRMDYDLGLLEGIGNDAVLFATRVKIREFLEILQKKMPK
jgi:hypothetical protein